MIVNRKTGADECLSSFKAQHMQQQITIASIAWKKLQNDVWSAMYNVQCFPFETVRVRLVKGFVNFLTFLLFVKEYLLLLLL